MKQLKFQCKLLSDVVLNQNAASEGPNSTLDFIPGNCFLGIVASGYDSYTPQDAYYLFHSGHVRFGDAHPSAYGQRTLRASACLFSPKLENANPGRYFNSILLTINSEEYKHLQLKQMRDGFFDYSTGFPIKQKINTSYSIKSAYDRDNRRSADEKMFGYEALTKGQTLLFDVEVDDVAFASVVTKGLLGVHRVGRSRSAQYGLVKIELFDYKEESSNKFSLSADSDGNIYTVYADGRLIFIDDCGLPTVRPKAEDLGFSSGSTILWDKSQIRTFQYAPYNWKRKHFDADRYGIEKGSVFVMKSPDTPVHSSYVGYFNNEGFGKVIYNPSFLQKRILEWKDDKRVLTQEARTVKESPVPTPFVQYLESAKATATYQNDIFKAVNEWKKKYGKKFLGEDKFASQWGAVRQEAVLCKGASFDKLKDNVKHLLTHGVSSKKWEENNRLPNLVSFLDDCHQAFPGSEWLALVNLSSEMAKMK